MSVYVDEPMCIGGEFDGYCHMWADHLPELFKMADRLGLHRSWFQNRPEFPHYDISRGRRAQALKFGAQVVSLKEWLKASKSDELA